MDISPQELSQAAFILQHASMDELNLAFRQGPPELKDLVSKELERRIASGDTSGTASGANTQTSPPSLGALSALGGQGGFGNDPPPTTPISQALTQGPSMGPGSTSTMPRASSSIMRPQPGPLSAAQPIRQPIIALRPTLTRGAISPLARVPARLGAPQGVLGRV